MKRSWYIFIFVCMGIVFIFLTGCNSAGKPFSRSQLAPVGKKSVFVIEDSLIVENDKFEAVVADLTNDTLTLVDYNRFGFEYPLYCYVRGGKDSVYLTFFPEEKPSGDRIRFRVKVNRDSLKFEFDSMKGDDVTGLMGLFRDELDGRTLRPVTLSLLDEIRTTDFDEYYMDESGDMYYSTVKELAYEMCMDTAYRMRVKGIESKATNRLINQCIGWEEWLAEYESFVERALFRLNTEGADFDRYKQELSMELQERMYAADIPRRYMGRYNMQAEHRRFMQEYNRINRKFTPYTGVVTIEFYDDWAE